MYKTGSSRLVDGPPAGMKDHCPALAFRAQPSVVSQWRCSLASRCVLMIIITSGSNYIPAEFPAEDWHHLWEIMWLFKVFVTASTWHVIVGCFRALLASHVATKTLKGALSTAEASSWHPGSERNWCKTHHNTIFNFQIKYLSIYIPFCFNLLRTARPVPGGKTRYLQETTSKEC